MKNLTLEQRPSITDGLERTLEWRGLPPIRVDSTQPSLTPETEQMPWSSYVLANGLIEDGDVLKLFAHRAVEAGLQRGQALKIYRHSLPMTGPAAYDPYVKSNIFRGVTEFGSMMDDGPLGVLAHSQGCGDVTMLSIESLVAGGYVNHLTSVSPAGHCPGREYTTRDVLFVLGRVLGEAAPYMLEPAAYRTLGACAINGIRHVGGGLIPAKDEKTGRWTAPAVEEAKRILHGNYIKQVANLSRSPHVSVLVMPGNYDTITGSDTIETELLREGYRGDYRALPTNHIGPILDKRCSAIIIEETLRARSKHDRPLPFRADMASASLLLAA